MAWKNEPGFWSNAWALCGTGLLLVVVGNVAGAGAIPGAAFAGFGTLLVFFGLVRGIMARRERRRGD